MRLVAFLILACLFWAEPGSSHECLDQLATRLGSKGATTLVLKPNGQLETVADGYAVQAGARVSHPSVRASQLPVAALSKVTGLAAELLPDGSQTLLGVIEANGALNLVSPLGKAYPFLAEDLGAITSLAFHTSPDKKTITLYVGAGQRLYRSTIKWRDIDPQDTALQSLLMGGLVKVTNVPAVLPGQADRVRFAKPDLEVFDFSGDAKYLLGVFSPNRALEITDFERVLTFKDENRMRRIDFISVLDENRAVVGSNLGQTLLIDLEKKETEFAINFRGLVLIDSLSGYRVGDKTEVWATDSRGNLYRWRAEDPLTLFTQMPFAVGEGVTPKKVATVAFEAPRGYSPGGREGYLSLIQMQGQKVLVERVVVLASNGNLYGYAEAVKGIILGGSPERIWLKVEKPAAK